jgi:predicted O-linked N-acetylglucosamine transferase (SPINDLY family)
MRKYINLAARAYQEQALNKYQCPDNKEFNKNYSHNISQIQNHPLRIGYLSNSFRCHSVGFLCYQTLLSHDPNIVQTYVYAYEHKTKANDEVRNCLMQGVYCFRDLAGATVNEIVKTIRADDLDILVYLDTYTSRIGCDIVSLRVAPIQISWLGGDSPGLPNIDYFIADPYVLSSSAQDDYHEKILRLPTFVAVDSFKVAPIDLPAFRQTLGIDSQAIVYWTAALSFKRNLDCINWQLEILRQVPNGILVVKGVGDMPTLISTYQEVAERKGVIQKLRFLSRTPSEEGHRAQVGLADIILDTYPYTGATHSIEALWRGVPIVTRAGQHYYSRMSYSLIENIGTDIGIAWSAEEYIQWGVQLGTNPKLLQSIKQTIQASLQTSALWNARKFANNLESMYASIHKKNFYQQGDK